MKRIDGTTPQSHGEIITSERCGTDGKPREGVEMEHDYVATDGTTKTFSCFVSTRHDKNAVTQKLRDGWRINTPGEDTITMGDEPAAGEVPNG